MNILDLKFIFVGDSCVGKTSLLTKYTDNVFRDIFQTTIGVEHKIKIITIKGYKIRAKIYDTVGQEKFRSIIKNYYRNNNGIFLVFDLTNKQSFENLDLWLNEINSIVENKKIIILGNKIDLNNIIQVSDEDILNFKEKSGFQIIKTSAKDGKNIEHAFKTMFELIIKDKNQEQIYSEFCCNYNKKTLLKKETPNNNSNAKCC